MSLEIAQYLVHTSESQHHASPRDARVAELFGTDLEFLSQNGDLDLFYFNEDEEFDGLTHTLIGDERGGFHSESAARILGLNHPVNPKKTMVDRAHLKHRNSKERRGFAERSFEPFAARVVVNGTKKLKIMQNSNDSEQKEVRNSMFPSEYDPTSIVRAVAAAYKNRVAGEDKLKATADGDVLVNNTGWALMLDGTTKMKIRLVLNPETEKIVTASPLIERTKRMNLGTDDINRHLGGEEMQWVQE